MPGKKLKEFLDNNNIKYVTLTHSVAYTAQEIASVAHIRGQNLAKTVIVKLDGALAMAVLPASRHIDLSRVKAEAGVAAASLAGEWEFRDRFGDCETGAMPPFGNLYGMDVFVDQSLTKDKEIAFNAGTHNELVQMAYEDFARLVKPKVAEIAAGLTRTATG